MLITFKSPAASDTTYVGPIGERFLKMMGRSKNVPGAMFADDVPGALAQLRDELQRIEEQERQAEEAARERRTQDAGDPNRKDENGSENYVSITRRAHPLIQLLEKSIDAECEVIWE
ncbi:DUF1840 domain-containing protein [Hydrocarboniclastica marina]|uniref:DUF1840 domain-containing protein n=1 Tax=Hydrocarboniclastica marina TaxID=2259620 RepID=A0A4P7XFR9_9ALTE|nr:DUF1840 domain-containing protein [Hydrocarboniclastica marina]MAL98467.1 hypothetical protein [Alteromonadaceae bacterium]QCF25776.1 DUF1840 domain-containing protein [Hydrocarboniclastica marina]|tara:strand:- start:6056 stop:6406 length:351 start_codon:yes stop_codon:yes gene_type:complete